MFVTIILEDERNLLNKASKERWFKAEFEKVSEFQKVVAYGVMAFPALVIDEKLVAVGSTLSVDEAMTLIKQLS